MVGADESTELWRHPSHFTFLLCNLCIYGYFLRLTATTHQKRNVVYPLTLNLKLELACPPFDEKYLDQYPFLTRVMRCLMVWSANFWQWFNPKKLFTLLHPRHKSLTVVIQTIQFFKHFRQAHNSLIGCISSQRFIVRIRSLENERPIIILNICELTKWRHKRFILNLVVTGIEMLTFALPDLLFF